MATAERNPSQPHKAAEYFDEQEWMKLVNDDTTAGQYVFGILTGIVLMGLVLGFVAVVVLS